MLTKLYTRAGDRGFTSTPGHGSVSKSSPIMESLGDIDELNSVIGLVRNSLSKQVNIDRALKRVQKNLVSICSCIASGEHNGGVSDDDTVTLEVMIDRMQALNGPSTDFIEFNGTRFQMLTQLARAVCRRSERALWSIEDHYFMESNPYIAKYMNRLSDFLFALGVYGSDNDIDSPSDSSEDTYGSGISDCHIKSCYDVIMWKIADFQNFHGKDDYWYACGMLHSLLISRCIKKCHFENVLGMIDSWDSRENVSLTFMVGPYLEKAIVEGPYND